MAYRHDIRSHHRRSRGLERTRRLTSRCVNGLGWLLGSVMMLGVVGSVGATGYPGYTIDTFAGLETLDWLSDIAVTGTDTVYIADSYHHRVWKVTPDGIITTFAGTGHHGVSGDGGSATHATLSLPSGVAVADDGTVYIADLFNHRVRSVSPDGTIATLAGTGNNGVSIGQRGDGGPATAAQLGWPYDVAVDGTGTVYIADEINHRVRKVTPDGIIATIAGTGTAGDRGDGGPATAAQLNQPSAVAVASDGTLYIADRGNNRVRVLTPLRCVAVRHSQSVPAPATNAPSLSRVAR